VTAVPAPSAAAAVPAPTAAVAVPAPTAAAPEIASPSAASSAEYVVNCDLQQQVPAFAAVAAAAAAAVLPPVLLSAHRHYGKAGLVVFQRQMPSFWAQ
jgi:hypothetical protein